MPVSSMELERLIQWNKGQSKRKKNAPISRDEMALMYATIYLCEHYIRPAYLMILLDLAAFDGRQRYNFVDAIDKTEEDTKKVLARMKALGVVELRKHEYSTRRLWYLTPLGKQLVDNLFDIAQNYIVKQDPIYANTRGNIWNKIRFAARAEKDEYNELREITAKTEV